MGIKQKLRAMSVFAVGGIACALSTWRAVMVAKSATNPDQLYSFMRIDLLGLVFQSVASIVLISD